MFDEENLISLAIFLSFCPSAYVHPNPASHKPANYKKETFKWTVFFAKFSCVFLHNFRFFLGNFRIIFSWNFFIIFFRETDWNKISTKSKNSHHFCKRTKWKIIWNNVYSLSKSFLRNFTFQYYFKLYIGIN